jgi:hypothetical protein
VNGGLAGRRLPLAVAGACAIGLVSRSTKRRARPPAERPTLALLTSLPLVFGESFGLEAAARRR